MNTVKFTFSLSRYQNNSSVLHSIPQITVKKTAWNQANYITSIFLSDLLSHSTFRMIFQVLDDSYTKTY